MNLSYRQKSGIEFFIAKVYNENWGYFDILFNISYFSYINIYY